ANAKPVVRQTRIDAELHTEAPDQRTDLPRVAADDRRAAMGEQRLRNARVFAPVELLDDRSMTDAGTPATPNEGPPDRGAVTDVEINAFERGPPIADSGHVRGIEEAPRARRNSIADGRRTGGMLQRKRLEPKSIDFPGRARRDRTRVLDRKTPQQGQRRT